MTPPPASARTPPTAIRDISGSIGWCTFDYNTHKDFGSGDRICYHGVHGHVPRSRNSPPTPMPASANPPRRSSCKPVTFWARGERNIGGVLPLIILTNCDEVEVRYGVARPSASIRTARTIPHLPHPPVVLDHRHFTPDELGRWGMVWIDGTFTGFVDGKPVAQSDAGRPIRLPTTLEVVADSPTLRAGERDTTRVIIRALDQHGHRLPFLNDSITLKVHGPARIVGPTNVPLQGGTAGFWLEATGFTGEITVEAVSTRFAPVTLGVTAADGRHGAMRAGSKRSWLASGIEEHGLIEIEGEAGVLSWRDAGIGAQAGDDRFAAELGDGEGVGAGRFDHLDQAIALGQRARLAVGAIRIGHGFRADAEDHLFAGIGGQAVIA